jgi:ribosome-associated protein
MAKRKTKPKSPSKQSDPSLSLAHAAIEGIQEKKGNNVVLINLKEITTAVCDYFVICEGNSKTQVEAIADSVEDQIKKKEKTKPWHSEGFGNAEWILLDYGNVVVHIFQPETRSFYQLEELWADGVTQKIPG